MEFYQTVMGKRFFEGQMPKLIKEIGRLADAVETANRNPKEREPKFDKETAMRICSVTIVGAVEELLRKHNGIMNTPEGWSNRIVGDDYICLTERIRDIVDEFLKNLGLNETVAALSAAEEEER